MMRSNSITTTGPTIICSEGSIKRITEAVGLNSELAGGVGGEAGAAGVVAAVGDGVGTGGLGAVGGGVGAGVGTGAPAAGALGAVGAVRGGVGTGEPADTGVAADPGEGVPDEPIGVGVDGVIVVPGRGGGAPLMSLRRSCNTVRTIR